ncbi:hypothetical protein BT93_L4574 [Corymbia citriodora subsp. variegata]|uniref:Uncharacterized protein n=1 Tax=Corymbia citriodora subsp. variegata TaxID=360336 RepID=A0A8T0CXY8_CORYI|nr:hypothetical protein BT93_L4574 [Corymbia citriodora subsp. variegata]
MAHRKKAEEAVAFLLSKFQEVPNDLTPEEQKFVDDIKSALADLKEVVKTLDTIKPNDMQSLESQLQRLCQDIIVNFPSRTTDTPQLRKGSPNIQARLPFFQKYLLDFQNISKTCGKLKHEEDARKIKDEALYQKVDPVPLDWDEKMRLQIRLLVDCFYSTNGVLVTGRRGSGKTTLVRKMCEFLVRNYFYTIAWIDIPPVKDPDLIRHEIFLQLLENKVPVPDNFSAFAMDDQMLEHQIIALLKNDRCLIVVDNLVDQSILETFQNALHLAETGQVIFIAKHEYHGPHQYGHQLETFKMEDPSEDESWALFCSKTFPEGDVPSPLKTVCKSIVEKCERLPEAIHLFSCLLRNKKVRNDEWESTVASYLSQEVDLIQQVLKIIYQDDGLGSCLLYLSIFPDNSLISCMRISRLWAAEGFLYDGSDCDLGRAESFLKELLDRKWIHPVETRSDGRFCTFTVDNLVREIIVHLSNHRKLVTISSKNSTDWPERVRRLSVQGGTVKDLNEEKLSQLHSLFVFDVSSNKDETTMSEYSPMGTSNNPILLFNFKHLKVLDLQDLTGAPLQIVPEALFELILLRYLCLRSTSIKEIPGSIRKLKHLQFLDLKHSLVTELPKEVEALERIRHILVYHHEKDPLMMEGRNLIGFKTSCSIGGFKCLEKLCSVESDDSILEDLGNLTELRRLSIAKLRAEHGQLLCSSLEKLKKLRSLSLHALNKGEIIHLHYLSSPPESLEHLYLHGRLEKLPNWISSCSLPNLTKLILRWSELEEDILSSLGELPELVELELHRAYSGRQLYFKHGNFPKLKILLLDELEGLRSMNLEEGTLQSLEKLTISRCQWLERLPSGIEHIHAIRKLTFFDMSREFYDIVRAEHEKDDYHIFKDIPEVYFTRWRAGHWKTHPLVQTKVMKDSEAKAE